MALEFSLAHLTMLEVSSVEMIDVAYTTGYGFVSLRLNPVCKGEKVSPLATDRVLRRQVKARLADTGIRLLDIEVAQLGPHQEPEDYLAFLELGAELGARHVICQLPDADRTRAADRFAKLCELARPFGLTVDLEFVSWTETSSLGDAAEIVQKLDVDNAGILVDTLHFARSSSSLEQLKSLPREWFHFSQVCDADKIIPDNIEEIIHTARHDRKFPGEGGIMVCEIINHMPQVPYALEIPNDKLRAALGNQEYARQAIESARHCLSSIKMCNTS